MIIKDETQKEDQFIYSHSNNTYLHNSLHKNYTCIKRIFCGLLFSHNYAIPNTYVRGESVEVKKYVLIRKIASLYNKVKKKEHKTCNYIFYFKNKH